MVARRSRAGVGAIGAALLTVVLAGCGGGSRSPSLSRLPLAAGAHVTVVQRACNRGSDAFCALQLVVVGPGYRTSEDLVSAETQLLRRRGWHRTEAPTGIERAASTPGDKLRVIYATANADLEGVDLGWIRRSRRVTLALSRSLFDHTSALSMLLQIGAA